MERVESHKLLGRDVMTKVAYALKPGGIFKSQDGLFGSVDSTEKTEAILTGLVSQGKDGMVKPGNTESVGAFTVREEGQPNNKWN